MRFPKLPLLLFCALLTLSGCAPKTVKQEFIPLDLNAKLTQKDYTKKVDNFLIIFDASSSMFDCYLGHSKVSLAKNTIGNMNQTIPALDMRGGLRTFGPSPGGIDATQLLYGMTSYSQEKLGSVVQTITTSGLTPLSVPLKTSSDDLKDTAGDIALIVISDGLDNGTGKPEAEADNLKQAFGERLCIYTILVGDAPAGRNLLEKISKIGQCGFAVSADELMTSNAMADYVEKVFLKKSVKTAVVAKEPVIVPPMPKEKPILKELVSINLNVEFDFDKDNVKNIYHERIKEAADFMTKFPETVAVIEGHTDSWGKEKYNMALSQRRAESVRQYLIKNFGIPAARLSAKGYGYAKPIADNETEEGRKKNRRVVAVISTYIEK